MNYKFSTCDTFFCIRSDKHKKRKISKKCKCYSTLIFSKTTALIAESRLPFYSVVSLLRNKPKIVILGYSQPPQFQNLYNNLGAKTARTRAYYENRINFLFSENHKKLGA